MTTSCKSVSPQQSLDTQSTRNPAATNVKTLKHLKNKGEEPLKIKYEQNFVSRMKSWPKNKEDHFERFSPCKRETHCFDGSFCDSEAVLRFSFHCG